MAKNEVEISIPFGRRTRAFSALTLALSLAMLAGYDQAESPGVQHIPEDLGFHCCETDHWDRLERFNNESLPPDIVSRCRLYYDYNTRIWDLHEGASKHPTRLHIRESYLQQPVFQQLASGDLTSLDVVLLDGPKVHAKYLPMHVRNNYPELIDKLAEMGRGGGDVSENETVAYGSYIPIIGEANRDTGKRYALIAVGGNRAFTHEDPRFLSPADLRLVNDPDYLFSSPDPRKTFVHETSHVNGVPHPDTDNLVLNLLRGSFEGAYSGAGIEGLPFVFETPAGNFR